MAKPVLGIMTLYLKNNDISREERQYFKKLIVRGKTMGLNVFVFTPDDVDSAGQHVNAHQYNKSSGKWNRTRIPLPSLIYDRCRFQPTSRYQRYIQFRSRFQQLTYLNGPPVNKWAVYELLSDHPHISPYLPNTVLFSRKKDISPLIKKYRVVYCKPINGTGGRGILRIERMNHNEFLIEGRDNYRRIIPPQKASTSQFVKKLAAWSAANPYIVQQGIDLELPDGRVHDFRVLIQKNGKGQWSITGCAGRIGPNRSITSNLHGGGTAVPMLRLLQRNFSDDKIKQIGRTVYQLSHQVANRLEDAFGRLCELGLDIAVDLAGNVWLLEVNPKPAREVFARIGNKDAYNKAISRPLEFALWLSEQK